MFVSTYSIFFIKKHFFLDYTWSLVLNGIFVSVAIVLILCFLWRRPIKRIYRRIQRRMAETPPDVNSYFSMTENDSLINANAAPIPPLNETSFSNENLSGYESIPLTPV
jgi:hypothetical protein